MLQTDIKNCYINNKEVSALWFEGNQIWTMKLEATGLGTGGFAQFSDWASLSAVTQAGNARDYFSVGDMFGVTMSDGTNANFIVVGINHEGNNGLIMMGMQPNGSSKWATSDTTSKKRYDGGLLPSFCSSVGAKLPTDLQAIVKPTTVLYNYTVANGSYYGSGNTTSKIYSYWIPSVCEMFDANTISVRSTVGTQWELFKNADKAKAFTIGSFFWTRDTLPTAPSADYIVANGGNGWQMSSAGITSEYNVVIVFRI